MHELVEVAVRAGDHPHVDAPRAVRADGRDDALLEYAEERHLERGTRVADLVEEDAAAIGLDEEPGAVLGGSGERAAHVAEELDLAQLVGDRTEVHRDEAAARRAAVGVDRLGHELLAGAGLAVNQDRRVVPLDLPEERQRAPHPGGLREDALVAVELVELVGRERHGFETDAPQPVVLALEVARLPARVRAAKRHRADRPQRRRVDRLRHDHGVGVEPVGDAVGRAKDDADERGPQQRGVGEERSVALVHDEHVGVETRERHQRLVRGNERRVGQRVEHLQCRREFFGLGADDEDGTPDAAAAVF